MPKASSRPSLPTSSVDFALPPSSTSNAAASSSSLSGDEPNLLLLRFRRPSILAPKASYHAEGRLHSPLAASFTLSPAARRRRSFNATITEDLDIDKDRMWSDSSPSSSSENPTPPLAMLENGQDDQSRNKKGEPATPPRKLSPGVEMADPPIKAPRRRFSIPLKPPRIMNLLAESKPEESEVKSEAAFQRLVSSGSELPTQPRTPRHISDRGRYPEEAGHEESQREDTPSDDEDGIDDMTFAPLPGNGDSTNASKTHTPSHSIGSIDDLHMYMSEYPSTSSLAMDVDAPSSSTTATSNQWRYTPPPTSSAVRSNKRKLDDRYDPYPTASKRRAVSPSLSALRESHSLLISPILNLRSTTPRNSMPIPIPISIPGSTVSSAASSPTISNSYTFPLSRPVTSSPTLRASVGLASPIVRPIRSTNRRAEGEEREIEGAGEAVGGLSIA